MSGQNKAMLSHSDLEPWHYSAGHKNLLCWEKSKTRRPRCLVSWCREPLSQMSCNSVPRGGGAKSNRRIWATGITANKLPPLCCNEANQRLLSSLTPTEHLFVPDGPLASCVGALMWLYSGPLFTCKTLNRPALRAVWTDVLSSSEGKLTQTNLVTVGTALHCTPFAKQRLSLSCYFVQSS